MKPRIRWRPVLRCWAVHYSDRGHAVTTLTETWPEALAVLGIGCPEGWR